MAINADANLWHAVLFAALNDAAGGKDTDWIGSADFQLVCSLANFDADAVEQRFTPEAYRRRVAHCGT